MTYNENIGALASAPPAPATVTSNNIDNVWKEEKGGALTPATPAPILRELGTVVPLRINGQSNGFLCLYFCLHYVVMLIFLIKKSVI